MNYYPGALAPAGYGVATTDKAGMYAASPYPTLAASPYATAQPCLTPGMQQYAPAARQYAVVSQATPAAYYASGTPAAYTTGVPLSSLQTMSSTAPQSAYLGAQYPPNVGVQTAMLGPTSVAAAGYGGSHLYAANTYAGLPTAAVPGQPGRSAYGVAPVGYAAASSLPPSSPAYPGATAFSPPY